MEQISLKYKIVPFVILYHEKDTPKNFVSMLQEGKVKTPFDEVQLIPHEFIPESIIPELKDKSIEQLSEPRRTQVREWIKSVLTTNDPEFSVKKTSTLQMVKYAKLKTKNANPVIYKKVWALYDGLEEDKEMGSNKFAICMLRIKRGLEIHPTIYMPILVDVTGTKNEDYFKAESETGRIPVPALSVGGIANWRDLMGGGVRNAFDKLEKEETKKLNQQGIKKIKQKLFHNRLEIILTYYLAQHTGWKMLMNSQKQMTGLRGKMIGLSDILGPIDTEPIPTYVIHIQYKAGNTSQISILFEKDGIANGTKLAEKKLFLPVFNLKGTAGLDLVRPQNIREMMDKAEKIIDSEIFIKISNIENEIIKQKKNDKKRNELDEQLNKLVEYAKREKLIPNLK